MGDTLSCAAVSVAAVLAFSWLEGRHNYFDIRSPLYLPGEGLCMLLMLGSPIVAYRSGGFTAAAIVLVTGLAAVYAAAAAWGFYLRGLDRSR